MNLTSGVFRYLPLKHFCLDNKKPFLILLGVANSQKIVKLFLTFPNAGKIVPWIRNSVDILNKGKLQKLTKREQFSRVDSEVISYHSRTRYAVDMDFIHRPFHINFHCEYLVCVCDVDSTNCNKNGIKNNRVIIMFV